MRTVSQLCLAHTPRPSCTPGHRSCPLPLQSHSPSGQDRGHNPDERWVKGKVVLREKTEAAVRAGGRCPPGTGGGGEAWAEGGRHGARLTLKEKLRRMKSAPSFSLRVWRSLCKALSWSTLGSESGLRPLGALAGPRPAAEGRTTAHARSPLPDRPGHSRHAGSARVPLT